MFGEIFGLCMVGIAFSFMITAGCALIFIIILYPLENLVLKIADKRHEQSIDRFFGWALAILVIGSFIFHFICIALPMYQIKNQPWSAENYVTHQIINIADNNEINGQLYYRKGYIEEKLYYHYYFKTADGGLEPQKVSGDSVRIYPTDEVEPCAKWYKETRSYWWLEEERYSCKIYVPENTVTTEFSIDMK